MKWLRSFIPPFLGSEMIYRNNKVRLYRLVINSQHLLNNLKDGFPAIITILKIILLSTSEIQGNYLYLFKGFKERLPKSGLSCCLPRMIYAEKMITTTWQQCIFITCDWCKNIQPFVACLCNMMPFPALSLLMFISKPLDL